MYGNWEYGTDWLIIWHKLFNSKARICDITINLSNRPEVLSWPPVALKNSDACIDWTSGLRTGVTRPVDINPSKQTSINDECHSTKPQILNQCYNKIWSYGGGVEIALFIDKAHRLYNSWLLPHKPWVNNTTRCGCSTYVCNVIWFPSTLRHFLASLLKSQHTKSCI